MDYERSVVAPDPTDLLRRQTQSSTTRLLTAGLLLPIPTSKTTAFGTAPKSIHQL
jgi:hypothetical protein